jgi:hypothetical protein
MASMKLASEIIPPFLDPYLETFLIFDETKD